MPVEPRHAVLLRRPGRVPRKVVVAGAALALAAGVAVVTQVARASNGCDAHRPLLEVAVSRDIAPAISRVADGVRDPDGCREVRVRAVAEADVLTALQHHRRPDVWIPDSTLWVQRARTAQVVAPADPSSIASSPLVLAVPRGFGDHLPHGDAALQWQAVVDAVSAGQLVLHLPGEASSSTAGVLVALKAAADQQPDARAALTGLLRAAQVEPALADGSRALSVLSSAADAAVPVPEQAVFTHTGLHGAVQIAAVYPGASGSTFDYPFTILGADGALRTAADHLLAALRSTGGQARLRTYGFRGVDGVGAGLTADRGVDGTRPGTVAVPDAATADQLVGVLRAVHRDARILAVADVSGSMAAEVPGSAGSSRLDLALRAAAAGLEFYPDTTEVGLWSFSEDLSGTTDYQELAPIAPLGAPATTGGGRVALALAMARMRPVPDGGTGLYDTTLAAVRAVRAGWDPTRVNAVVLLTDGDDTDADGIGLDELLTTLRSEQASGQPVPVITIGYGADAGVQSLAAISAATGGASYQASDPGQIRDIFLDAVGQRACRPDCQPATGN